MSKTHPNLKWAGVLASVGALAALSGCKIAPPPRAEIPQPALQLMDSSPLVLADDCRASGSYFVQFTVQASGRTADAQVPPAPACVREALTAWVGSFRYSPPGREMPAGIEWMLVTARKGS